MTRFRGVRGVIFLGVIGAMLGAVPGLASPILLSEASSDETAAEALFAELRFDVVGSVLEVTVLNRTDESNVQLGTGEYAIDSIYFNATANVSGLALVSPAGWSLETNARGGGEFGRFDFALIGSKGKPPHHVIDPGASLTFELLISGTGPFAPEDFTTVESSIPPGSMPMIAQAKFVMGPGDDSAFGASATWASGPSTAVPEAGTTLLLAAGVFGGLSRRRRLASPG